MLAIIQMAGFMANTLRLSNKLNPNKSLQLDTGLPVQVKPVIRLMKKVIHGSRFIGFRFLLLGSVPAGGSLGIKQTYRLVFESRRLLLRQ